MRKRWIIATAAGAGILVLVLWPTPAPKGSPRFFADPTYHFETLRVLGDIAEAGGDANEALQALPAITTGDANAWESAWHAAGDRAAALAQRVQDKQARGDSWLRAHTYYRSAEFFLSPADPRRPELWRKNVTAFEAGLDARSVVRERFEVPYGQHHLNAIYYPGPAGAERKPLLILVNGYDGTMEELYLQGVAAALRRGYNVLTYEGPGQGAVLREQGLTFQPDWEKPNGAVLDRFLATHPKPAKIVLIGMSMGGYLAPRAAAFDHRIDGLVAFDVFYDGFQIAGSKIPPFIWWLRKHGYTGALHALMANGTRDPGAAWAVQNGEWVFGVHDPLAVVDSFGAYRLAPVASRITADTLILAGADDHMVPVNQFDDFRKSLTGARSVTAVRFETDTGAAEHCQLGAPTQWQATLFDWLAAKFPAAST